MTISLTLFIYNHHHHFFPLIYLYSSLVFLSLEGTAAVLIQIIFRLLCWLINVCVVEYMYCTVMQWNDM